MSSRRWLGVLFCLAAAGCGEEGEQLDPKVAALRASPAVCGAPPYTWLDDARLGEPVASEPVLGDRVTVADIQALFDLAGAESPVPLLYSVQVHRFRYVTQDRGALREATALLAFPNLQGLPSPDVPLITFLHGTTGATDACAPSGSIADPYLAAAFAAAGYVYVAPDYLGMVSFGEPSPAIHPYLVAEPTAIASLDAVRAARRLLAGALDVGVRPRPGTLVMGGSQGGHASLFVARYQPYYAPEEEVIAVAASVPPADLVAEAQHSATQIADGNRNVAGLLAGYADWYGIPLSEGLASPFDVQVPERLLAGCNLGDLLDPAQTVEEMFSEGFLRSARRGFPEGDSRFGCALRANSLMHTSVEPLSNPPTLFVLSELDELVYTAAERMAFEWLCDQGLALEYLECAGASHTEGALASLREQVTFLQDRAAGVPWDPARICHRSAPVVCSGMADAH